MAILFVILCGLAYTHQRRRRTIRRMERRAERAAFSSTS
jgi:hypothetical protein